MNQSKHKANTCSWYEAREKRVQARHDWFWIYLISWESGNMRSNATLKQTPILTQFDTEGKIIFLLIATKFGFLSFQISTNVQSLHHFQTKIRPSFKAVMRKPAVWTLWAHTDVSALWDMLVTDLPVLVGFLAHCNCTSKEKYNI